MALLLPIALLGLFYVFLILPKQRELKRHNALVASLEVGDEVMTGSGFYGTLTEIDADTVLVELAPGLEVKLARRAIAAKVPDPTREPIDVDEVDEPEVIDVLDPAEDPADLTDPGELGSGDGPAAHDGPDDRPEADR
jgi:preprotein translocase subunit YajC